jgi:hypothetical protein
VATNVKTLGTDLKAMPRAILNDGKAAATAFKNGQIREGLNAFHDNSLIAAGKDAYGVVKDTKSFVTDTVGIVTDPFKFLEGKAQGLVNKNFAKVLKPLENNASTKLMRDQVMAHVSDMMPV